MTEPMLVQTMRRQSNQERHIRDLGSGTTLRTFLAEFDAHVASMTRVALEQAAREIESQGCDCGFCNDAQATQRAASICRAYRPEDF